MNEARKHELTRYVNRLRLRVGAWILGDGWFGAITRLQLIHDRARQAVNADGRVTLAACPALAEALYAPIDGVWTLAVTRHADVDV